LLKEVAPNVTRVAGMVNPETVLAPSVSREIDEAARSLGMTVTLALVRDDAGIEEAIAAFAREPGGGLMILPGVLNQTHRDVIAAAAARYGLPSIGWIDLSRAGVLMSYWYDRSIISAQGASYIDRILKGASPADLPVQQPTKYSLIINLKTAKVLGLTVPPAMLDLADEVID
jgi:putative ABC transport system substrate-binding protein